MSDGAFFWSIMKKLFLIIISSGFMHPMEFTSNIHTQPDLIKKVLNIAKKKVIWQQNEENLLKQIARHDSHHWLLKNALEKGIIAKGINVAYHVDDFLYPAFFARAYKNAELLLQYGADPDFKIISAGEEEFYLRECFNYRKMQAFRLLLRYGADLNKWRLNYAFPTGSEGDVHYISTLLYYGLDPSISLKKEDLPCSPSGKFVDILCQGHARRVHRMAHYLNRCCRTLPITLPIELWYKIAEQRYNPLNKEDWKLIEAYSPEDYKKAKKKEIEMKGAIFALTQSPCAKSPKTAVNN
jgi:hypothetical protein